MPRLESSSDIPQSPYAITLQSCPEEVWAPELVTAMCHVGRLSAAMACGPSRIKAIWLAKLEMKDTVDADACSLRGFSDF